MLPTLTIGYRIKLLAWLRKPSVLRFLSSREMQSATFQHCGHYGTDTSLVETTLRSASTLDAVTKRQTTCKIPRKMELNLASRLHAPRFVFNFPFFGPAPGPMS